ncbi:MAG TPA: PfkB family carbohydrate kinase [Candidatus Bathyarchaeia archaeon]|nr:PfkB family carbohydrate kinase [Candidatus Bathyarchaeia archaeon]
MTISHIVTGVINWDKTIFVKRFPIEGEEIKIERIIDILGGKGANVAVASSRILGKHKVALFGALGSDFIADKQLEVLRNQGILTNLIQFTRGPSGQAYIIVDSEGRNTVMTFRQANDILNDRTLESKNMLTYIAEAPLVTVVDPPIAVAKKLIVMSAANQKIVVWAPGLLSSSGIENIMDIIDNVNFLILNESECSLMSGIYDPLSGCNKLSVKKNNMGVIVTRGEKGCIFGNNGEVISVPTAVVSKKQWREHSRCR